MQVETEKSFISSYRLAATSGIKPPGLLANTKKRKGKTTRIDLFMIGISSRYASPRKITPVLGTLNQDLDQTICMTSGPERPSVLRKSLKAAPSQKSPDP